MRSIRVVTLAVKASFGERSSPSEPFDDELRDLGAWTNPLNESKVLRHAGCGKLSQIKWKAFRSPAHVVTPRDVSQMPTTGQIARKKCSDRLLSTEVAVSSHHVVSLFVLPELVSEIR